MQVGVIGSHDAEIFGKKRTLPYILRIKLANITLFNEKKMSIVQKGLNNVYKNNYNICIFYIDKSIK